MNIFEKLGQFKNICANDTKSQQINNKTIKSKQRNQSKTPGVTINSNPLTMHCYENHHKPYHTIKKKGIIRKRGKTYKKQSN